MSYLVDLSEDSAPEIRTSAKRTLDLISVTHFLLSTGKSSLMKYCCRINHPRGVRKYKYSALRCHDQYTLSSGNNEEDEVDFSHQRHYLDRKRSQLQHTKQSEVWEEEEDASSFNHYSTVQEEEKDSDEEARLDSTFAQMQLQFVS